MVSSDKKLLNDNNGFETNKLIDQDEVVYQNVNDTDSNPYITIDKLQMKIKDYAKIDREFKVDAFW